MDNNIKLSNLVKEDLRKWFKQKWVNIGKKVDGKHPPCGTSGEKSGYAKCVPAAKAAEMSKKEKESATRRKRAAQNDADRGGKDSKGQGKAPINVSTKPKNEEWSDKYKSSIDCNNPKGFSQKAHCQGKDKKENNMKLTVEQRLELFLEKNCPTDPGKWSASKSAAKSKFDVYPSAYANGWASKNYKEKGGGWKACNEGVQLDEACWDGYKQVGMKDKGGRQVPNCVPVSEDIDSDDDVNYGLVEPEEYDVEDEDMEDFIAFMRGYDKNLNEGCQCLREAEYQGREVQLGKPMQGDVKKFKVYVKNPKGNVVKVNFVQKGMKIRKSNPKARKSFRARMNCDSPGPRDKARYWSCRKW